MNLNKLAVLDSVHVNILINGSGLQLLAVQAKFNQVLDMGLGEVVTKVPLVLLQNVRLGLLSAQTVAEGSLNDNLLEDGSVVQLDGQGVGNGSEGRVVVVLGELRVLDTLDLLAERLDQFRGSSLTSVSVVGSLETTENKHDSSHVLNAVVTVGKVVHGLELLVDDANAGLVCAASNSLDVSGRLALLLEDGVNLLRSLDGRLRVELSRVRDLEEDILHDVAAVGPLELELLALEQDIVETPDGGRENGRDARLALEHLEGQVDSTLAGITGGPRLSRHGVWRVAVGSQALAVDPSLGDGVGSLLLVQAEHLGDDGSTGNLDEHDMVKTDLVVRVEQSQASLNLVRLDHGLEDITDGELLASSNVSTSLVCSGDPIGDGENGTKVVGRVTPFSGQPAVIVVQPSDHGTNVEGGIDGVQLEVGTGDLGSIGDDGAGDNGAKELCALLEAQAFKTATQGVEEDPSCGIELWWAKG